MRAVAIDGPAGAGKSTIAKRLARILDLSMWIPGHCTAPSAFIR